MFESLVPICERRRTRAEADALARLLRLRRGVVVVQDEEGGQGWRPQVSGYCGGPLWVEAHFPDFAKTVLTGARERRESGGRSCNGFHGLELSPDRSVIWPVPNIHLRAICGSSRIAEASDSDRRSPAPPDSVNRPPRQKRPERDAAPAPRLSQRSDRSLLDDYSGKHDQMSALCAVQNFPV